ncbi:hypothetical protein FRC10_004577 [Ceratobasidium sp. 414]|nr:hypothetical protein FRC10_004577 [Ceratobasidium sp. 414]
MGTNLLPNTVLGGSAANRLKRYASAVKTLKIHSKSIGSYIIFDESTLASHLQSQTLLPQLQLLDFTNPVGGYAADYQFWVKAFACDSLVEIRVTPGMHMMTSMVTGSDAELEEMVQVLVDKSPNIQKLTALFPTFGSSDHGESETDTHSSLTRIELPFQSLESLSKLRDLSCNSALLAASLRVLGHLSQLQSLAVWSDGNKCASPEPGPLSDKSFPALTRLTLHLRRSIDAIEVESLMCMIPVLRQLTTLELFMEMYDVMDENSWVQGRFLPSLKKLENLRNLHVDFCPDGHEHKFILHGCRKLMDSITSLPLETVYLDQVDLGYAVPYGIKTGWPQVTRLSIPFQRVYMRELSAFAGLRSLQHLTLALALSTEFSEDSDDSDDYFYIGRSVGRMLHTLEGSAGSRIFCGTNEIDELARYFAASGSDSLIVLAKLASCFVVIGQRS